MTLPLASPPPDSVGPDDPRPVQRGQVSRAFGRTLLGAVAVSALVLAAGCGKSSEAQPGDPSADSGPTTLTVYTDQHAELIEDLTKAYTDESGVKFNIQQDATVGQIQAEGGSSKADVFLSEDPGPVALLGKDGLLAPVDAATLEHVRPGLSSGKDLWVAYAARTRVLFYNPTMIKESELPKTLADIVEPQYKGEFAWAPSGAFVSTTQYLISTLGEEKTTEFLEALKTNGVNEKKNGNVRDTVEAGKHAMGLSNHYYWWILASQKGGPENLTSKIYHFPEQDPGNLILSSGAAVLKSSTHPEAAQEFLAWLTSKDGGQKIVAGPIEVSGAQYPVAKDTASSVVGDLSEVKSPAYDMDELANSQQAADLLKKLGMSSG